MAKTIKHLPPNLSSPSIMSKVDYSTINGQELQFTPLRFGKEAHTKDWPNSGLNDWDIFSLIGNDDNDYTGIGLIHKLSKTVAFDIDDMEKTIAYFKDVI